MIALNERFPLEMERRFKLSGGTISHYSQAKIIVVLSGSSDDARTETEAVRKPGSHSFEHEFLVAFCQGAPRSDFVLTIITAAWVISRSTTT